ncbi:hypothetical protein L228DRAFT_250685 [Xylona heveae TC161]|uniref:Kinetochore protein fta4 n=1 Tax=Xylona heveae (strain CBS 132557 / TC161) TaxID=1328760 RepID=A0A164ZWX8_XYLHT|nr:hypothetical protein L228DRAFT_250685 [Xylona heveae TC161]KZF19638.1 hypothetical protein L228DRAFT_250685 [Xylona heveae TC161]
MSGNGETVVDLKQAFLRQQVRLLSQPLQISRDWRDRAPDEGNGPLREKVVDEVLHKLNAIARRHNKSAYSSEALRHVAEQIDALYWESGAVSGGADEQDRSGLELGADLAQPETIEKLPEEWPTGEGEDEAAVARYQELRERLFELSTQRQAQRQRFEHYKQLQKLVEPFRNAHENVQPNLVTRDGELGKELDKMRIFMARVTGKLADVRNNDIEDEVQMSNTEEKLAGILGAQ